MCQETTGKVLHVKRGFSVTYMIFGAWVALFRGHVSGFFTCLLVQLFSGGLGTFVLAFHYNGMYINWLVKNGYKRVPEKDEYEEIPLTGEKVIEPEKGDTLHGDDNETRILPKGGLIGIKGFYQGAEIPLNLGEKIVIGRDQEKSNLIISAKEISRKHCEISFDPVSKEYIVCDESTNGVYLGDGSRIESKKPVHLKSGTVLQMGQTEHMFKLK
ncbi:FHA domain-containing protein [Brotaphodocola sp.]|uniref:FHA domain-containing protein n=1 Tax=Brotaphodocola sp. TaxID=3073577 RepID=UPI003D7D17AF